MNIIYNTYHNTVNMKPVMYNQTHIDFNKEKYPKFKVGHFVRILKYKNIFAKVILQIGLKKIL